MMDDSKTVFCGNLSEDLTEELLYELFLQVAPLARVKIPTDKDGRKSNFGFVTFKHEVSVPYAVDMLNGTKLFDKAISVKPRKPNNQRTDSPLMMNVGMQGPYDERGMQFGYPMANSQHLRFNEYGDPGSPQMNYEEVLRIQQLGQMLQGGPPNFSNPYDMPQNDNHGRNWRERERENYRGGDYYHRDNYRDRSDHNRDRAHNRRHDNEKRDYPGHKNKRNDNHRSGGYERNNRRRY